MNVLEFSGLLFGTSLLAGFLGALTGLGGGVVIVPVLALFFKMDIRYAIGASLVSVIATSSGAAVAYVREGLSNIRIGMFLEVATTLGACYGAYLAIIVLTFQGYGGMTGRCVIQRACRWTKCGLFATTSKDGCISFIAKRMIASPL
jgi:uncharacterized membrane protein YfcA